MKKKSLKIISVGGSIIIPKSGFNIPFLKKFRKLILDEVKNGTKFVLIIGGGATCRQYQDALKKTVKLKDVDLDWMGIHTTMVNAQFVKFLFKDHAYKDIITDPTKKVKTNKPIIIAAGYQPGWSTDTDAVLMAKAYGATDVINLSNIDYVYDKDPAKFKSAKKIEETDWKTFRRDVVGNTWDPGKNAPFDPIASREAQKLGLRVSILKGTNLGEVKKVLGGKKFKGTVIE
ncbi:UMP kinase [Candidatus Parcubacteria bacterium]|jgi:uridylate kinase|nr:UMP kinase [Candidatus Parcubacteria bacterium]MBT3948634.1 UMP kinase [Candidatus Parcubacteria bacterium]